MGHSVPAAKRGFPLSKCLLTDLLGLIDTLGPNETTGYPRCAIVVH